MKPALVTRHHSWRHLISDLQNQPQCSFLRRIKHSDLPAVLAPPIALARWISTYYPELTQRHSLRILVAGAQYYDAFDQGRWYGLIPALLGCDSPVEITLVGVNLDTKVSTPSGQLLGKQLAPAIMHKKSLKQYFDSASINNHDLACVFHPGFEIHHRDWLNDRGLGDLIAAKIPAMGTSYTVSEFQRDDYVLRTYGYGIEPNYAINPFHMNFADALQGNVDIKWAQVLWKFSAALPDIDHNIDNARLVDVAALSQIILQSTLSGLNTATDRCAQRVIRAESENARDYFIHIFNDFVVRENSLVVYVDVGGTLKVVRDVSLSQTELAERPCEDVAEIERAIWGAKIMSRWSKSRGT